MRKYYRLSHAGNALGTVAPIVPTSMFNMFRVPWYRDGFEPPRELDQGE